MTTQTNPPGSATVENPVSAMRRIFRENRAGNAHGIYSVCSAHPLVLDAAFAQASADKSLLLIEATCNQVNQDGGYTGLTPSGFRDYVHSIAAGADYPLEQLILGGDHLGPNPWRSQPAATAMEKASVMVHAYALAGFAKIHLDASMRCADDPTVLSDAEIAERAARLCEVAEDAAAHSSIRPVYIVGTEVPIPGGAQGELEIDVTSIANVQKTLEVHRYAFERHGLSSAWERVVGVVVQPGVEFGDEAIADYIPRNAAELSHWILSAEEIVFEAHSTDYQLPKAYRALIHDGFAILKVGPALTFAMREALEALSLIEAELVAPEKCARLMDVLEQVMLDDPRNWEHHYAGDERAKRLLRRYSYSDRLRYYWNDARVKQSVDTLMANLSEITIPQTMLSAFLPDEYRSARAGNLKLDAHAIILHRIREVIGVYAEACKAQVL